RQFGEFRRLEYCPQMLQRAPIDLVGFRRAEWRPGEILQIKIRPFPKTKIAPPSYGRQGIVVSGLQAFSEASLRFIPILSAGRFTLANTGLVPVLHPPDRRSLALIQAAIMLYRSCHPTTSCLNLARKGSN